MPQNKAADSGFETQRRRHQKSKTVVSVGPKKGHASNKNKKKNPLVVGEWIFNQ